MSQQRLDQIDLTKIFFLDIETVSQVAHFGELETEWQQLWEEKTRWQRKEDISAEEYYPQRAGILAEFAKVICVSIGYFERADGYPRKFRIKSFASRNEAELLEDLSRVLQKEQYILCAHNGKEFDFPFLARRYVIHGMELPEALNMHGKKPWEIQHLDTMELWKFGDFKHFTSLKLLAACFGIPSPKGDIDGSQVGRVFWEDDDLDRIVHYCERDTLTVAQVMLKMTRRPLLEEEEILFVG